MAAGQTAACAPDRCAAAKRRRRQQPPLVLLLPRASCGARASIPPWLFLFQGSVFLSVSAGKHKNPVEAERQIFNQQQH